MEKEIVIQRLSYIKYPYLKGEEQSRQAIVRKLRFNNFIQISLHF